MAASEVATPLSSPPSAVAILKEHFSDLKIRFVNVVDLFRLMPESEHPHGLSDRDFDSLFTVDKPVIFNFRSYAALIHKLSYRPGIMTTFTYGDIRKKETSTRRSSSPFSIRSTALIWRLMSSTGFRASAPS